MQQHYYIEDLTFLQLSYNLFESYISFLIIVEFDNGIFFFFQFLKSKKIFHF